jgi:hypothetical protein
MPWPSDPAVPDLPLLADLDAVGATLPGWRATRRLHLRWLPGRSCTATFDLEADGTGERSIGVVSAGPDGVDARLYLDDPALPGLRHVADGVASARRLGADGGTAEPVRYRPGSRCTFGLSDGSGAPSAFAKVLPGAGRLRDVSAAASAAGVPVAAEVAWWPELGCVVQRAVPGAVPLGAVLPARPELAADAGVALARLHSAPIDVSRWPVLGLEDDIARLDRLRTPVAAAVPELLAAYDRPLAALTAVVARGAGTEPVPGHGAYRAGQLVLGNDGRMVVLDLDGACRSEPARDLGNFLAYLRWHAMRHPEQRAALAGARDAFLHGYGTAAPAVQPARLAQHEAASLVKIAGRRTRDLSTGEWPLLPGLLEQAERMLS